MDVAIDTGGTFTDCLARLAEGSLRSVKVPSTPRDPSQAILRGLAELQALAPDDPIRRIVHGSTVATNALLEGVGEDALLILPSGFEDLLELGRQQRPELYTLHPVAPVPALRRSRVLGIPARLSVEGEWLAHWTDDDLEQLLATIHEFDHLQAIGICLLHGQRFPEAEQELVTALQQAGLPTGIAITCSSDLSRVAGEFERATTTALNARLLGPVSAYLGRLDYAVRVAYPSATLEIVLSNGDAVPVAEAARCPVRMLLSGPAGGVQLGWQIAQAVGRPVITLDIGGTSTDVACIPAEPLVREEGRIEHFPLRVPMLDIETIGAGGGSVVWLDAGGALQVGPRSSGAVPGPASYGQGGHLPTLTDAHVVAGHLPDGLELPGGITLSEAKARHAFTDLVDATGLTVEVLAEGAIAIANQRIVQAIRAISSQRGIPPAECALVVMGGAGGLHGALVAAALGIDTLVLPPYPGLASAQGLSASRFALWIGEVLADGDPLHSLATSQTSLLAMAEVAWQASMSLPVTEAVPLWTVAARYRGQDRTLLLPLEPQGDVARRFRALAQERFGAHDSSAPVELVRLELALQAPSDRWPLGALAETYREERTAQQRILIGESFTLLLPADATAVEGTDVTQFRLAVSEAGATSPIGFDAVGLTLANDLFASIAEDMALTLEQLGHSSNIKDRRDLSTALFDGEGQLLAQGAHIPVHLGSITASVTAAREAFELSPGDAVILNSPFAGGTHLPDLTLVTCVSLGEAGLAYVASRAHHADIGGSAPGSMPLTSRAEDEGLLIPPTLVAREGRLLADVVDWIAEASRQPAERRGDLAAQFAANQRGAERFAALVSRMPAAWYQQAAVALIDYAANMVTQSWRDWRLGSHQATVIMESDGLDLIEIEITVAATLSEVAGRRHLRLDFTGTDGPVPGPINCPRAVVQAAVAFVLRALAPEGTPANAGLLRDVEIVIPEVSLLNAQYPSATSAGNVETSQKLVMALQKVLTPFVPGGLPRPSQGTMNNVLIGGVKSNGEAYTYYETLAGGCGAGPQGEGASAVHSHMTNSRNTPIEILEERFPLVIEQYALRPESGGWPATERGYFGGLGIQRAYRFLADATLTLIADWPRHNDRNGPKAGVAYLLDVDDTLEALESKLTREVKAGQILLLATPGGWAWDPAAASP